MKKVPLYCVIVLSAVILACGMANIAKPSRTVTVRGLAEREVDADIAIWPLSFSVGNDDLRTLQNDVMKKTQAVTEFLSGYELTEDDWTVQAPAITDNTINVYVDQNRIPFKYIAKVSVLIRSPKIDCVKNAQKDSLRLAEKGIAVSQEYGSRMSFEFTALNDIKPEMIAQATQNARLAAEQFANDSGSKVGKIKTATQGLFSIDNAAQGLEEKKKIRVVTTVEYLLK